MDLVRENHRLLSEDGETGLGVSHPSLSKICAILEKHGFAGKLTGAGGGGCVIGFAAQKLDEFPAELLEDLEAKNFFQIVYKEL